MVKDLRNSSSSHGYSSDEVARRVEACHRANWDGALGLWGVYGTPLCTYADLRCLADVDHIRRGLTKLNLSSNELTDAAALAACLRPLTCLTTLYLWNNQLSDAAALAGGLRQLTQLTTLNLGRNQFSDARALAECLEPLKCLTVLDLSQNRFSDAAALARCLSPLTQLRRLDLGGNQLSDASELVECLERLKHLTVLGLSRNRFSSAALMRGLGRLTQLVRLDLHDNPGLRLPSEVTDSTNPRQLSGALDQIAAGQTLPVLELKLVLLGNGRVGKSQLARRLMGKPFDDSLESTPHFVVHPLDIGNVTSAALDAGSQMLAGRLYDFGGQPHLWSAHRFFLASRHNLYVVVIDGTREGLLEIRYVRELAGRMTYIFTTQYPRGLHEVKDYLRGARADVAGEKLEPFLTFMSRTELIRLFRVAAGKAHAPDDVSCEFWLKMLRNLGVVHWVGDLGRERRVRAGDMIAETVYRPEWVQKLVYGIIATGGNGRTTTGVASEHRLCELICLQCGTHKGRGRSASPCHRQILDLMSTCELVFVPDRGNEYLVLDWIHDSRGYNGDGRAVLTELSFDRFLPESLLMRCAGRWYEDLKMLGRNLCRNMVRVSHPRRPGVMVEVIADVYRRRITLYRAGGPIRAVRRFAGRLHHDILQVARSEGLEVRNEPKGTAMPAPPKPAATRRFAVAVSFPGEHRDRVREIESLVRARLVGCEVFFDERYEHEIAGFEADLVLQRIYHDESELVVLFFCKEYQQKEWCCKVEWRAIRDLIKKRRGRSLLPLRFDMADVEGVFSTDICPDVSKRSADEIADLIVRRLELVRREGGARSAIDREKEPADGPRKVPACEGAGRLCAACGIAGVSDLVAVRGRGRAAGGERVLLVGMGG